MADTDLASRRPHGGLPTVSTLVETCGVVAVDRDRLGIATVLARRNMAGSLAEHVRGRFSLDLPQGPRRVGAGDIAFVGTGPGAWLAMAENGGNAFAASLRQEFGEVASISDQSDAYAVLRLAGPKIRETLAKGFPVDLHARAFGPGDVASTVVSHIGAILWRLEDADDGTPAFEVAVFRSFADSFWHWLSESAAEYGLRVVEPGRG